MPMVVPNRFAKRGDERELVLRALAVVGALMGAGAAAARATAGDAAGLAGTARIGLAVALLAGLALAMRVWVTAAWDDLQSALSLVLGVVWLLLGFLSEPAAGVLPVVLGAALAGVGLGGFATRARFALARPRPG